VNVPQGTQADWLSPAPIGGSTWVLSPRIDCVPWLPRPPTTTT